MRSMESRDSSVGDAGALGQSIDERVGKPRLRVDFSEYPQTDHRVTNFNSPDSEEILPPLTIYEGGDDPHCLDWIYDDLPGGIRSASDAIEGIIPNSLQDTQIDRNLTNISDTTIKGPPTISPQEIDAVLASHDSPAAGQGEEIFQRCTAAGIDPAVALAFFACESTFGTAGVAVDTHSWGNIKSTDGDGYVTYPNFMEGLQGWLDLMNNLYVQPESAGGFGVTTAAEAIPIYAPSFENDTQNYIKKVTELVTQWRQEDAANFGGEQYSTATSDSNEQSTATSPKDSNEAQRVAATAEQHVGEKMWADCPDLEAIQYGYLGCAASVSQALIDAGVMDPSDYNMSVFGVETFLQDKGWVRVDGPMPGAVVCGYRSERPGVGGGAHIGIVGSDGETIYNNHSDTGQWTADPLSSFSYDEYPEDVAYYVPAGALN